MKPPVLSSFRVRRHQVALTAVLLVAAMALGTFCYWRTRARVDTRATVAPVTPIVPADTRGDARAVSSPQAERCRLPRFIDIDGNVRQVGHDSSCAASVFVFLATHCPISNSYLPELNRLHRRFSELQVEFFGVIADRFTNRDEAIEHSNQYQVEFSVVLDAGGVLQRTLCPTHTPQAVVLDRNQVVVYSGAIDDLYHSLGRARQHANQHFLEQTLETVSRGETPGIFRTDAVGCLLEPVSAERPASDVTFCRDVAPILFANCTRCHRSGEATPFPLMTYEDVRRRAHQVATVVEQRIMPPWKPVAGYGHFLKDARLQDEEIEIILDWARHGTPLGDPRQLPTAPVFTEGWQMGIPDLVLEMPEEFNIPADGPDIYRHFVIPTGLIKDGLIAGFEFRPGSPSVVHHSFLYFDTRGEARQLDDADPGPGYSRFGGPGFTPTGNLGGWGPGGLPRRLPNGIARPVPANSDLVLQIHYHPTGKPERDRSKAGLYFAEWPVMRLAAEIMVADVTLDIPPGARQYRFDASYTLPVKVQLLDASPHMHLLGRKIQVQATTPDGRQIPLIRIDDWNFFWQDHYVFRHPVSLPAGTRLDLTAWYDNSTANPQNPNSPLQRVRFGEDSRDEMGICYFQVTTDSRTDYLTLTRHTSAYFSEMLARYQQSRDLDGSRGQTSAPSPAAN